MKMQYWKVLDIQSDARRNQYTSENVRTGNFKQNRLYEIMFLGA